MSAPADAPRPEPPCSRFGMTMRSAVSILVGTLVSVGAYELVQRLLPRASLPASAALTCLVVFPVVFFVVRKIAHRGLRDAIVAVSDGMLSLTEKDYGLRLAVERRDEVGMLVHRFNTLAATLRRERNDVYQREMLLETVLGATTMAAIICNEARRVIYSNAAARQFFCGGRKLEGQDLRALLAAAPSDVQAAARQTDVLFTCDRINCGEPETFRLTRREFELSGQRHTLFLLKPLTQDLARKEVETWKKAIRVMSHEVNNSLAPITSLIQTARLMLQNPAHAQRLAGALDTIEERAAHLRSFLDGYARFARLPMPNRRQVVWSEILAGIEGLYSFKLDGPPPQQPAYVDPAQIQQVLINLLKNAAESGSAPDEVVLSIREGGGGVEVRVTDRGKGMSDEVLRSALLPFYSTNKPGTGLGLPLCREILEAHGGRLSLHRREGGGVAVLCWIPEAAAPPLALAAHA